jgi:4-hydroxyacetophenone monooxygenase
LATLNLEPDAREAAGLAALAADPAALRAALAEADAATLMLVLVQITGDRALLERARPHITGPMNYHETMPEDLRAEIRQRLEVALLEHARTGRALPALPEGDFLQEMLSTAVGEHVSADYCAMMREDLEAAEPDPRGLIGSGMSGVCAAIRLSQAGIPFTIIEKNSAVGGSWYENFYPGCGVDTPNHFYSYSFDLNHEWSHFFAKRDELWAYFERATDTYGIRGHIRFETEVASATYDDATGTWDIVTRDAGGTVTHLKARAVISAVGVLNRPKLPEIPGRESFVGTALHTAQWQEGLDLSGKRVVMVGTGASGQQVGPTIAPDVAHLTVLQRSPHWVVPNPNYFAEVSEGMKWTLAHVPFFARWYRFQLFWAFADGLHASLQVDPEWEDGGRSINQVNARHRLFMERYLRGKLAGRDDLIAKCTPSYPPYGKRILVDNNWYEMLLRPNVDLVTSKIARIVPEGVVMDDGALIEADVIIYATGFQASKMLSPMTITGSGGRDLHEVWGPDDATAYIGTMVPGFPNFFTLMGPNTGLAHGGNVIFITECQMRLILTALREVLETGAKAIDVQPAAHDAYVAEVDHLHANMVWTHKGLTNWYRNDAGRVFALLPYRLVDYWKMTKTFKPEDFTMADFNAADFSLT